MALLVITSTAHKSPPLGVVLVVEIPLVSVSYLVWEIVMAE